MPRRPSNHRRVDVQFTQTEYAIVARGADAADQNVTAWVRACAIRASSRSDAVVRGVAERMASRDAAVVRVLASCGLLLDRLTKVPLQDPTISGLVRSAEKMTEDIVACIKLLGGKT
jgi:hypothetical protein